ncbi:MAG: hypothetical protein JWM74_2945, partial [Myxococcaceae bacterium]|nr:hypothetical protein [Myxococcaceae bacterium]
TSGLTIVVDGGARDEALWGTPLPVDPGLRVVAASAAGKKTRTTEVQVEPSERQVVTITPLEDVPAVVAPLATRPAPAPIVVTETSSQRVLGYVVGGTGIAAIGVGTIFGALALSSNADSKACATNPRCTSDTAYRDADRNAWVANVAIPVGVVALGVGIVLVLTAHDERVARTLAGAW